MTQNVGGRPQTYIGGLEDRIVEVAAVADEFVPHDASEWQRLNEMDACDAGLLAALDADDDLLARHYALQLRRLHKDARVADIHENKRHRLVRDTARGAA